MQLKTLVLLCGKVTIQKRTWLTVTGPQIITKSWLSEGRILERHPPSDHHNPQPPLPSTLCSQENSEECAINLPHAVSLRPCVT